MGTENSFEQSGVIPYKKNGNLIEVLLVTTIKKKKWIIPKGYVEFNLTPFESAKKEAYEEAGVIGSNETTELGLIKIEKPNGIQNIKIFSMEVIEELKDYPEKNLRKRKWFSQKDAAEKVEKSNLSKMILRINSVIK